MKAYTKPSIYVQKIVTMQFIAASGNLKTDVSISDSELKNVTFGSRDQKSFWDDEEE